MMNKIFKIIGLFVIILISTTLLLVLLKPRIPLAAFAGPASRLLSSLSGYEQVISGRFYLVPGSWTTLSVEECTVALTGDNDFHLKADIHSAQTRIQLWPLLTRKINLDGVFVKGVSLDLLTGEKKEKSAGEDAWLDELQFAPLSMPLRQTGDIELADIGVTINHHGEQPPTRFRLEKGVGRFGSGASDQLTIEAVLDGRKISARVKGGPLREIGKKETTWSFSANLPHSSTSGHISLNLTSEVVKLSAHLNSSSLNVGAILAELQLVEEIGLELNMVEMDLDASGRTLAELLKTLTVTIQGTGDSCEFQDPNSGALLPVSLHKATLTAVPGDKISFTAEGEIVTTPISMEMEFEDRRGEAPGSTKDIPFTSHAFVAGTSLELSGKISLPFTGTGVSLNCRLHGEQLSSLNDLLKVKLPELGPYDIRGRLNLIPKGYQLDAIELQVGSSSLGGHMLLDTTAVPPAVAIVLQARTVQLDDFKEIWLGTSDAADGEKKDQKTEKTDSSEQEQDFLTDQTVLDSYDAALSVTVQEVYSGEDYLGRGLLKIEQQHGSFRVSPLQIRFPKGIVDVDFSIDPAGLNRRYFLEVTVDDLDYGFVGRWFKPDSEIAGSLSLHTLLESESPDFKSILANGSGSIKFLLQPERMQAGVIDMWAVNLLSYVTSVNGEEGGSTINCAAGRFTLKDGLLSRDELLIDTSRIRIGGNIAVDFHRNWIEGRLRPRPKRPQFFSLATPIQISGPLSGLDVGMAGGGGVGTLVRLATDYITVPLQWIVLGKLPEDGTVDCRKVMEPENQKERIRGDEWYSSPR